MEARMKATTLEHFLLHNATERRSEKMTQSADFSVKTWWENLIERTPVFYVSVVLCLIGGLLLRYVPPGYLRHSIGEALFVAGLLVLLVDPYIKARLLKEASRGIFHYLLGYDQQPEIKDRLRSLVFDTKLFRRDLKLNCTLVPDGDSMRLECEIDFEIVNPTSEVHPYTQTVQFERVERAKIHSLRLVSPQENYSIVSPTISDKIDDPVVLEAKGKPIQILPAEKGMTYRFGAKFSVMYPEEFFYAVHVALPTIGMTVEVTPPSGFDVTASPTPTHAGNLWSYEKLFMPGEHVDVRWQRKTSQN